MSVLNCAAICSWAAELRLRHDMSSAAWNWMTAPRKSPWTGEPISLTPIEYDILKLLMESPGKVYSPKEIYRQVWKEAPLGSDNTVAVHIRHLREKIEINPADPRYLKVVWGQGYKMEKGAKR